MVGRTLLLNARILTMQPGQPEADALLIEGERIVWVGPAAHTPRPDGCTAVDLAGRTVLPAFADCHMHLTLTGLAASETNLGTCRSRDDVADRLSAALRSWDGQGVFRAWNYDDQTFPAGERLDRQWLDFLEPCRPVFLSRVGNAVCLLNTAAMEQLGLTPDLMGVTRDAGGTPSGQLWGPANHWAVEAGLATLGDAGRSRAYKAAAAAALANGVTCLHAIEGSYFGQMEGGAAEPNRHIEAIGRLAGELPLEVVPMDTAVRSLADLDRIAAQGRKQVGGDIFMDGVVGAAYVPGAYRAALSAPYADGQGGNGHLLLTDEQVFGLMERAAALGLQLSAHAVGDRTIDQFLRCWRRVVKARPDAAGLRPRIEHGILPRPEHMEWAAELGVVFSMQPAFEIQSGGVHGRYMQRLGPARIRTTHPLKGLLRAGVRVAGGSDAPVQPVFPLQGVQGAANHPFAENRITVTEALEFFTTGAAWAAFQEGRRGRLAAGMQADFAVLTADPHRVPLAEIAAIQVDQTWHRGRCVFRRPGSEQGRRADNAD